MLHSAKHSINYTTIFVLNYASSKPGILASLSAITFQPRYSPELYAPNQRINVRPRQLTNIGNETFFAFQLAFFIPFPRTRVTSYPFQFSCPRSRYVLINFERLRLRAGICSFNYYAQYFIGSWIIRFPGGIVFASVEGLPVVIQLDDRQRNRYGEESRSILKFPCQFRYHGLDSPDRSDCFRFTDARHVSFRYRETIKEKRGGKTTHAVAIRRTAGEATKKIQGGS